MEDEMFKIYLDYYAGSVFTFPLDRGPEPEGTTDVDQGGLSSLRAWWRNAAPWWSGGEHHGEH